MKNGILKMTVKSRVPKSNITEKKVFFPKHPQY